MECEAVGPPRGASSISSRLGDGTLSANHRAVVCLGSCLRVSLTHNLTILFGKQVKEDSKMSRTDEI